jgi:transcription antitermination factor NusG
MDTGDISGLYWFAIHVKSRHEFKVADRLIKSGIEVFLPAAERLTEWKDRNKLVRFPLFPCYLFVHTTRSHHEKLTVLKTQGVINFLNSAPGEPESIPEEQIISLKQAVESKAQLDPYPYLQAGQRIRIKKGPLKGVEGILVEKAGQHKLILSVDLLRQSTAVTIQSSDVEGM